MGHAAPVCLETTALWDCQALKQAGNPLLAPTPGTLCTDRLLGPFVSLKIPLEPTAAAAGQQQGCQAPPAHIRRGRWHSPVPSTTTTPLCCGCSRQQLGHFPPTKHKALPEQAIIAVKENEEPGK